MILLRSRRLTILAAGILVVLLFLGHIAVRLYLMGIGWSAAQIAGHTLANALGITAGLSALALWSFCAWLMWESPRNMSASEAAYWWQNKEKKPNKLAWPDEQLDGPPPQTLDNWRAWQVAKKAPYWLRMTAAFVLVASFFVSGAFVVASPAMAENATVHRVIDGDTVDVDLDGEIVRVRILNIDAPEDNAATGETECLGREATATVQGLLPVGSRVRLKYDRDREDQYGRTLASVETSSGVSVANRLAEQGLGSAVSFGNNVAFFADVAAAERVAQSAKRGIYRPAVECGPMSAVPASLIAPSYIGSDAVTADELLAYAAALAVLAEQTDWSPSSAVAEGLSWLSPSSLDHLVVELRSVTAWATEEKEKYEDQALELIAAAEAEAEALRLEEEQARAEAEAEAAAQRERLEREAEAEAARQREAEASRPSSPSAPAPSETSTPSRGWPSDAGYTGCRDYSGVGMIDSKGRLFKPIPCP